jgi:uncharacterized coiled-coil protein SlyX
MQPNDNRLTDLELRYMALEKLTHELSGVVAEQGQLLDRLRTELGAISQRLQSGGDHDGDRVTLTDERPPHY